MDSTERAQLKEEIRTEILQEIHSVKKGKLWWTEFKKKVLLPTLYEKLDAYTAHRVVDCLATLLRVKYHKSSAIQFKEHNAEEVKADVAKIFMEWYGLTLKGWEGE